MYLPKCQETFFVLFLSLQHIVVKIAHRAAGFGVELRATAFVRLTHSGVLYL